MTYVCLGALGVVLAAMKSHWGFLLLTFFLFHVFGILGTVPHELGHALAARALNLHLFQVVVGVGKKLFECRILGVLVEFHWPKRCLAYDKTPLQSVGNYTGPIGCRVIAVYFEPALESSLRITTTSDTPNCMVSNWICLCAAASDRAS